MGDEMALFSLSQRRRLRRIVVGFAGFVIIGMFLRASFKTTHLSAIVEDTRPYSKALIVASLEKDDTSWLDDHLSDWKINRFVVDNLSAQFTVPKNKGREAMVYLT
jgi:hypothetical protein